MTQGGVGANRTKVTRGQVGTVFTQSTSGGDNRGVYFGKNENTEPGDSPPDDDDDSTSAESEDTYDKWRGGNDKNKEPGDNANWESSRTSKPHMDKIEKDTLELDHLERPGTGVSSSGNSLMRAFQDNESKYAGTYTEDLDRTLDTYDNMALGCGATMVENRLAMVFILKGNAASFFNAHGKRWKTYQQAALLLRRRFNSSDKRSRILITWQCLRLTEEFARNPNESQTQVFLDFTAKLMQLQKQLDTPYHADRYLRDKLLTAVDVPHIQTSLRDRIPRTSEQAICRVMNRLSDNKRSAGGTVAYLASDTVDDQSLRASEYPRQNKHP